MNVSDNKFFDNNSKIALLNTFIWCQSFDVDHEQFGYVCDEILTLYELFDNDTLNSDNDKSFVQSYLQQLRQSQSHLTEPISPNLNPFNAVDRTQKLVSAKPEDSIGLQLP